MFIYLFDGFQRRFSTPSMSKPMRMRPKRQRISDLQLRIKHQHHNRSLPESHNHRIISSISREISVSIAHESHHDLSRTREFFFFTRGLWFFTSRSLIDFAMIGVHRLNRYSTSFKSLRGLTFDRGTNRALRFSSSFLSFSLLRVLIYRNTWNPNNSNGT